MSIMSRNVLSVTVHSACLNALLVNLAAKCDRLQRVLYIRCPSLMNTCDRTIRKRVESKQTKSKLISIFLFPQASGSSLCLGCLQTAVLRLASLLFVYRSIIFYPFTLLNGYVCKQRSTVKLHN